MLKLTLYQLDQHNRAQVDALIKAAGGISHLAKMLNVNYMNVKGWKERGRVSHDGAVLIHEHPILGEKFSKHNLRPDLFTEE